MPQLAYTLSAPPEPLKPRLVGSAAASAEADGAFTITWSDGHVDTITGGTQAKTTGGSAQVDSTRDLYLIAAQRGAATLTLVKLADMLANGMDATLGGTPSWGILAELTHNRVREHQQLGDSGSAGGALAMAHDDVLVGTEREISLNDTAGNVVITPADDPAHGRVDYDFDLSAAILGVINQAAAFLAAAVTCTAYWGDGIGTRELSLWNGSGNNAPPAGWQTTGFDESSWPAPVDAGPAHGVWTATPPASGTERILFREHIGTPDALAVSVSITLSCDGSILAAYWNGASIGLVGAGGMASVSPSTLTLSGPNVLAVEAQATSGAHASLVAEVIICATPDLSKGLPVAMARDGTVFATRRIIDLDEGNGIAIAAADDPAHDEGHYTIALKPGTKGDIAYFDGSLWQFRHIGTFGQVLTVSSDGVPVWQQPQGTPVAPTTVASGPGNGAILVLGNSGSGYLAEPSGWAAPGFDDSAWQATVDDTGVELFGGGANIAGTRWVTYAAAVAPGVTGEPGSQEFLIRQRFVLGQGVAPPATLLVAADADLLEAFVNGVAIGNAPYVNQYTSPATIVVPGGAFIPGGENVIGFRVRNGSADMVLHGAMGIAYKLTLGS